MRKQQRWSTIVSICHQDGNVDVKNLTEQLHVSEATIRRDLQQMEELNMIDRYYGGAKLNNDQYSEPPMVIKSETNNTQKQLVGRLAASLIKNNQMVYLDAGSATYAMLPYITAKDITVTTISIPNIQYFGQRGVSTIVLGGNLHWSTEAVTGNQTLKQLDDLFFDVAFIGVNGIHERVGLTTSNEQEAAVKLKIIEHSAITYVMADSSKFNKLCPVKYADLNQAVVLSDDLPDNFKGTNIRYMLINGNKHC